MYLVAICRRGVLPDHITEFLSLVPVVLPTRGAVYSRLYHGNVMVQVVGSSRTRDLRVSIWCCRGGIQQVHSKALGLHSCISRYCNLALIALYKFDSTSMPRKLRM